jgi:chromosomal replication initiation ATPase DnaA|tara:strand:+ start:352 stop:864 length:513 start_codon:yes stop_codon:yes gene_type:complete
MTINVSTHYNKHIKHLDQNNFIYKVKKAFYLLTNQEERLYEVGFSEGFLYAAEVLQKEKIQDSNVKKIIGYKVTKPKPSDVQSIINRVCVHFEVHKETLMNKSRTTDIVRARNVIHNLLYEKYYMNLTDIGRYFGQDHTTVLHSIEMKKDQKRFWSPEQSLWQEFEKLIR